jgi:hypothetical protein
LGWSGSDRFLIIDVRKTNILGGHGSHLITDFTDYRDANKTFIMVILPLSTHSLQPLDVVMFLPLSKEYSAELSPHLRHNQGLIPIKKSDVFPLLCASWTSSFTFTNILRAFEGTGVAPPMADVVLRRFNTTTPEQDRSTEIGEHGDGNTWKQLRNLFDAAVKDTAAVEAKRFHALLHSLQVQNCWKIHESSGYT